MSGSAPTTEPTPTREATSQAFTAIFGTDPVACFDHMLEAIHAVVVLVRMGVFQLLMLRGLVQSLYILQTLNIWGTGMLYALTNAKHSGGDSDIDGICDDVDNCLGCTPPQPR